MLTFLNKMFANKGLEFSRIIITFIQLPGEIGGPLNEKAQYESKNEFERTKHAYHMRLLNDEQELQLIQQMKTEEREQANENFKCEYAQKDRDLKVIKAQTTKEVAEIKESATAESKMIEAEGELQAQLIRAETQLLQAQLQAKGKAECNTIRVDAENYCNLTMAQTESEVADLKAKVTHLEGNAEKELANVLACRRQYEYLHAKLDAI
mmetsp:Transcript_3252/g.3206  ORF Transcript_3252/g.3206 Transcript_3252/m.3206 type:complete len:209 (+) Transcript_3252:560-1186(+)